MATSHDFDETLSYAAPAGGATAGTMLYNATSKMVVLPLTTATSGNTFTAKIRGLVKGAPRSTAVSTAWTVGIGLAWVTATSKFKIATAASLAAAQAAAVTGTTDTTGDVILIFPARCL
jgi:hypothetical protein